MKLQKETKAVPVHGKWYGDACGTAFAMELIGERWSLLIVRELMFGGRRFSDLRGGLPGISAKVLTERLEGLERAGVLRRRQMPPPVSAQVYELTEWGYLAEDSIKALGLWAARSPDHDPTLPLSAASFMLSLRTMFDPAKAGGEGFAGTIAIGGESFVAALREGRFHAARGEAEAPDFIVAAPVAMPIVALVYGKVRPEELVGAGLTVTGDRAALARFVGLFHLPDKAVPAG